MPPPEPASWVEASCLTDRGLRQPHDLGRSLVSRRLGLAAVAHGMGGSSHTGVLGAEAVVGALGEWVAAADPGAPGGGPDGHPAVAALRAAHASIRALPGRDRRYQGIGAVAALVVADGPDRALVAHVGDGRVHRLRGGRLEPLTIDHTLRQDSRTPGSSSAPGEAARLPAIVTRALGLADDPGIEARHVERRPGDLFMVSSRGLAEALSEDALVGALTWRDTPPTDAGTFTAPTLAETCQWLVWLAIQAGSPHSVAVALARG